MRVIVKRWMGIFSIFMLFMNIDSSRAASKYGFGDVLNTCDLWPTFFPIGFRKPSVPGLKAYNIDAKFNVFYIAADDVQGMDDYIDLYNVSGSPLVWPTEPWLFKGNATPVCTGASECQNKKSTVGKGVSAYANLKAEFASEKLKVAQVTVSPTSTTNSDWAFIPVRHLKLLRVEVFLPNQFNIGANYSEPLYVEYRVTDNKNILKRVDMGGTSAGGNFSNINLPETINLSDYSGMEFWLINTDSAKPIEGLIPAAKAHKLTGDNLSLVPENCK